MEGDDYGTDSSTPPSYGSRRGHLLEPVGKCWAGFLLGEGPDSRSQMCSFAPALPPPRRGWGCLLEGPLAGKFQGRCKAYSEGVRNLPPPLPVLSLFLSPSLFSPPPAHPLPLISPLQFWNSP